MKPLLENLLNLTEDDIFKPYPLEEFIQKKLKGCTKNSDGTYSSNGDVDLSSLGLTELPVKFKEVKGSFWCGFNQLTSLEGCPRKVSRRFRCNDNKLTTLKGAPEEIGGDFGCSYNKLTSLEGAPKKVSKSFWCNDNQLITLKGAPEVVNGGFWCSFNPVSVDELRKTISRSYL